MNGEYPQKFRIVNGGPWYLKNAPFKVAYENPMHPLAIELREKYKLETVMAGAKTEFEKFLMLKEWVKRQMRQHGWSFNCLQKKPVNSLEILECVENGVLFQCLYHAKVFIQCCEALGYPARLVGARMANNEFPDQEHRNNVGHEIAEVWSNEYRKWVMMDCDTNSHYEKDGIPLSISEICLESNADCGENIEMVFGEYQPDITKDTGGEDTILGTDKTIYEAERSMEAFMRNRVIDYYRIVIANNRHDIFSEPFAKPEVVSFAPKNIHPMVIYNSLPYHESDYWTDNTDVFNWSVNETAINLKTINPNSPFPPLIAAFNNSMPNFDHYEILYDKNSRWGRCTDMVKWDIKEGINEIKIRAVNTMNIPGPAASARVLFEK